MTQSHLLTFTETEASPHITKCLDYFFDDGGCNKYTFSSAYLRYSKFAGEPFITTKRLFNIVQSTNLIVNEKIFRQQTTNGFNYFIDKQFYGLAERHHCRISRRSKTPQTTTDSGNNSTTSRDSPVLTNTSSTEPVQVAKDSSVGSLLIGDTWANQVPYNSTTRPSDSFSDKSPALLPQSPPTTPQTNDNDMHEHIKQFISSEIQLQLKQYHDDNFPSYDPAIVSDLKRTHDFFRSFEDEYRQSADKLRTRMEWVNKNMESYET